MPRPPRPSDDAAYRRAYRASVAVLAGREPHQLVGGGAVAGHVDALRADGWTYATVGQAAGCAASTVHRACDGGRLWWTHRQAILAVTGPPP